MAALPATATLPKVAALPATATLHLVSALPATATLSEVIVLATTATLSEVRVLSLTDSLGHRVARYSVQRPVKGGIDLGGTKIQVVIVDDDHEVVAAGPARHPDQGRPARRGGPHGRGRARGRRGRRA